MYYYGVTAEDVIGKWTASGIPSFLLFRQNRVSQRAFVRESRAQFVALEEAFAGLLAQTSPSDPEGMQVPTSSLARWRHPPKKRPYFHHLSYDLHTYNMHVARKSA